MLSSRPDAARRQVGNDSIPNACRGIVERGLLKKLQHFQKHRGAGNNQFGPSRADALDLTASRQIELAHLPVERPDFRD